jgi:hypothetical protein
VLAVHGCVLEHPPAQAVPEQVLGAQATVSAAGHMPLPSQVAPSVAVPLVQLAVRQETVAAGKAHAVRLVPSHIPPQVVPAPVHAAWPVRGAPLTAVQIPLLAVSPHDSHCPVQALLQQTPSAQYPLPHWVPAVQACPAFALQPPVASQLLVPLQLSASSAPVTDTHVPPPPVQAWQVPHDATPQQRPSTQPPLVHSAAAVQVWPFAFLHMPVASHVCIPLQVSSLADLTGLHVPSRPVRLHAVHAPVQAALQQYPSAHAPPAHSPAAWHVCPTAFLGTHLPALQ